MAARRGKGTNQFTAAAVTGKPKPEVSAETRAKLSSRSKGRIVSAETRKKISESRIRYLSEHPDQVPYLLNHVSKGPSYPETYWKDILDKAGIQYQEQYRVGRYALDFALVSEKIDLEIDGDQHYLDLKIVESDKRRNEFLKDNGWTVIRVRWSDFCRLNDRETFVSGILNQLGCKL